jgi:hypothetical protein
MKNEIYKIRVDTPDELLARILDAATCIKKRENQPRPSDTKVDGRIFRPFVVQCLKFCHFCVTKFVIETLN